MLEAKILCVDWFFSDSPAHLIKLEGGWKPLKEHPEYSVCSSKLSATLMNWVKRAFALRFDSNNNYQDSFLNRRRLGCPSCKYLNFCVQGFCLCGDKSTKRACVESGIRKSIEYLAYCSLRRNCMVESDKNYL